MPMTPEEQRAKRANYRAAHSQEIAEYDKKYQSEHRDRYRSRKNAASAKSYRKHRKKRLERHAERYRCSIKEESLLPPSNP